GPALERRPRLRPLHRDPPHELDPGERAALRGDTRQLRRAARVGEGARKRARSEPQASEVTQTGARSEPRAGGATKTGARSEPQASEIAQTGARSSVEPELPPRGPAAVDDERVAGHEGGVVGGEEERAGRDLLGPPEALHRVPAAHLLAHV